jgi:hypothetical protein
MSDTTQPSRSRGAGRARRSPAPGTAREDTLGSELERRVGRIEFAEGAFVRLRVPVQAPGGGPGRDVLTDIDVLSVDVDLRLRLTRGSSECKTTRGQAGEPSTIVWLAGFRQLLRLSRVTFARPTVSNRGRVIARRLGIAVLDEATLATREAAHRWVPERFAHLDGPECIVAEARTDVQLRGLPDIPTSVAQFLRSDAALADSPALLAGVESFGRNSIAQGVLPEPASTVLSSHALMAVLLAAIQDAARLSEISVRELKSRRERSLTTGDSEDDNLLILLERADALMSYMAERTHRAYTDAGAEPISIELPSLRDIVTTSPLYLDDYVDLVERIRANPLVSRDLLQSAELACFDFLLGGDAWSSEAFHHLFTPEHKGLLLVALRSLGSIAGDQVKAALQRLNELRTFSTGEIPDRRSQSRDQLTAGAQPVDPDIARNLPTTLDGLGPD